MVKNGNGSKGKELRIYVRKGKSLNYLSTIRTFGNLELAFRIANDGKIQSIPINRAISICSRIMERAKTSDNIEVRGTMIDEICEEDDISRLFNGEKIVLGG